MSAIGKALEEQDEVRAKLDKKRKGINGRRSEVIHGINYMINTNDRNLTELTHKMNFDDFKADLEEIINDGNFHSDEYSETDVERTLKILQLADEMSEKTSHIKCSRKRWYNNRNWADKTKPPIDAPEWAISATYHSEEEEEPSGNNNNNGSGSNGGSNSGSNNNGNGRTSISGYTSDENYNELRDDRNDNSEAAQGNNEAQNNSKGSSDATNNAIRKYETDEKRNMQQRPIKTEDSQILTEILNRLSLLEIIDKGAKTPIAPENFMEEKKINIMRLAETNLMEKEEKILLKKNKNMKEEPIYFGYVVGFQGLSTNIIVVYVVPTSAEVQKAIQVYLKECLKKRKRLEIDIENVNEKIWKEYQAKLNLELRTKIIKEVKEKREMQKTCIEQQELESELESKTLNQL
ncbi:hypothetical protein C2G38_2206774 [Gigaspora rosea]|uniref:Uncharacterized protein n=1 Tax=Gigaspora rosea TaxID=44941 RepID=A0A397UN35_9GLOM|nr:hypothetical protein C2G38_2206774 [Gigaspora rosea]